MKNPEIAVRTEPFQVPGSSFYTGKDKGIYKVRINFAKKESTLKEAAKRLRKLQRLEK